ncbi:hypothetical protein BaRGS_00021682, partial [Batillaria attramentaria]
RHFYDYWLDSLGDFWVFFPLSAAQFVLLTDVLLVLEALASDRLPRLMEKLQNIARTGRVALQ